MSRDYICDCGAIYADSSAILLCAQTGHGEGCPNCAKLRAQRDELAAACRIAKARWDFILESFPTRAWKHGDQQAYEAVQRALARIKPDA